MLIILGRRRALKELKKYNLCWDKMPRCGLWITQQLTEGLSTLHWIKATESLINMHQVN